MYREMSRQVLESQKICSLTRVICIIELANDNAADDDVIMIDREEQKQRLESALVEIEKCRGTCQKIAKLKRKEIIANNKELFGDSDTVLVQHELTK